MDATKLRPIRILMFPFLAYSHVHAFMELAKKLSKRNFYIYLCSAPATLAHIKEKEVNFQSIELVELDLPSLTSELPSQHQTTKGLPRHLLGNLKKALDAASYSFSNILTTLKPDVLIYDCFQPWAPALALSLNISTVLFFVLGTAPYIALHLSQNGSGTVRPLRSNYIHDHAIDDDLTLEDRMFICLEGSSNIVLIRNFKEIDEKYVDEYSVRTTKKMVRVGPLVQDSSEENEKAEITEWLDKKEPSSVLFVSFGSESYLSRENREELAHGLLLSNVSFIWVLRFPQGEKISVEEAMPEGFLEMVGERGLMVEEWAPQKRILDHPSVGGFVSHCGWSSVLEGMKFGVPIIAMPIQSDQPFNAKFVAEVGVGLEIKRELQNGKFERKEIAEVIRGVMMEETGERVRKKTRELSDFIRNHNDEEIEEVANQLVQLCQIKLRGTEK